MRLTEEIVDLLTALNKHERIGLSANGNLPPVSGIEDLEATLVECETEGWLTRNAEGHAALTSAGHEMVETIQQQLISADQLALHHPARIAYLSSRDYARFQKLSSLGLSPGIPIKVQQRFPSFVILCEETQIALEEDIARSIFVWKN